MEVSILKKLDVNVKPAGTVVEAKSKFHKAKKILPEGGAYGTGRRKNSVARVWVKPGKGTVTVNKRDVSDYFPRESYRKLILQPFVDTNTSGQYDVVCTIKGGGTTGQAGAIIHGIARALDCISDDFHSVLRKNGFLTRDSRVVERKKYGKRKARRSTQFSKR
ncbi:MAG: 30S ribosomal protein S9 [Rickettsiaceae bacterium]|jgi:small subunit ribosomal protein S9|nr:30S ribosomal protein S9 [Rickettsiaceae bacterium]MCP5378193.1 30S ribosomal protein S9 [Rickettsiaceae bacterium]